MNSNQGLVHSRHLLVDQNEPDPNQYGQDEAPPEKILLDEAEQIYSKFVDDIAGKCVSEMPNNTKSISQMEQVSDL